jgi:formyltetrahydrofolate hydrolase
MVGSTREDVGRLVLSCPDWPAIIAAEFLLKDLALARYMQILYARAHARAVKLIGATAHYATEELDDGPIIEQDVRRVSHQADPEMLTMIGRDIERTVFARAVHWRLENRILVHENRTIVFWPG